MAAKQYAEPAAYEAKLEKVMRRLGIEQYDYDWSRFECWVSFTYKGQPYRFAHSVENAKAHGVNIRYGSDVFAQVVLSLEDLARMVERGIYDLSTWVTGMKYLPAASEVELCFQALGFVEKPSNVEEIKAQYRRMAKGMHPDSGGDEKAFVLLQENYKRCLQLVGG
ncbi:MAG: J domain-containing protein [Clostridia bacterium]|nr:J domain-containing protein [Clostridia bacterium]